MATAMATEMEMAMEMEMEMAMVSVRCQQGTRKRGREFGKMVMEERKNSRPEESSSVLQVVGIR